MANQYQNFFPRYIDKPRLIGIFEMDEFILAFIIMVAILALSLIFPKVGSLTVMLVAVASGLLSAVLYSRFKRNMPTGYAIQKMYRAGIFSPQDAKAAEIKYPYIKKLGRVIPYGFTKIFYH